MEELIKQIEAMKAQWDKEAKASGKRAILHEGAALAAAEILTLVQSAAKSNESNPTEERKEETQPASVGDGTARL